MSITMARKYGASCGKCNTGNSIVIYYGKIDLIFELIHQMRPKFQRTIISLFVYGFFFCISSIRTQVHDRREMVLARQKQLK